MRSPLTPRFSIPASPPGKRFFRTFAPFVSQKCVMESPMKTILAPSASIYFIFAAWRFICHDCFLFPHGSCRSAVICATAAVAKSANAASAAIPIPDFAILLPFVLVFGIARARDRSREAAGRALAVSALAR